MKKLILLSFIICSQTYALSVFKVCNSIMDSNLRLECLGLSHAYFEEWALRVCLSFNADIDRRDCVNIIADKTFQREETISCMMANDQNNRFFCMLIAGEQIDQVAGQCSNSKIHLMLAKALDELNYGNPNIARRILQKMLNMTSSSY